jgi:hypothetical protein
MTAMPRFDLRVLIGIVCTVIIVILAVTRPTHERVYEAVFFPALLILLGFLTIVTRKRR